MQDQVTTTAKSAESKALKLNARQIALLRRGLFVLNQRLEKESGPKATAQEVEALNSILATA